MSVNLTTKLGVAILAAAIAFTMSLVAALAVLASVREVAMATCCLYQQELDSGLQHGLSGCCLGLLAVAIATAATVILLLVVRKYRLGKLLLVVQLLTFSLLFAVTGLFYASCAGIVKILSHVPATHPGWGWVMLGCGLVFLTQLCGMSANLLAHLFSNKYWQS